MNLFAQIRKVDEAKRLVFGRLAEEIVDKSDEIMDYASSKPHFVKWSEEIARDTDGKSVGNLRAMHGKVAAGKFTAIDFNDAEKAIDVCAKVVDENEWQKVLEGVYTGFSVGGAYVGDKKVEKMADGRSATRYTAKPSEGSLVDRPCIPTAKFFEVQKADGTLEKVDFTHQPEADPDPDEDAPTEDVTVRGTAEEVAELGKLMNAEGLTLEDVLTKALPAFIAAKKKKGDKGADADGEGEDDDKGGDDDDEAAKAEKLAADESLGKLEAAMTDALAKIGARNSGSDAARIARIHDMAVELGAACKQADEGAAKGEAPGALQKAADADAAAALQKIVDDAVAPLQKALDDANARIKTLADQPAPARIALRAVAKGDDIDGNAAAAAAAAALEKSQAPITDDLGDAHAAAGLIKAAHMQGGRPMAMPPARGA